MTRSIDARMILVGLMALVIFAHAAVADEVIETPDLPEIQKIELEPASLTLHDGRDARQVLVWGVTADGQRFDVSDVATFEPTSATVSIEDGRFIHPQAVGEAQVIVRSGPLHAKLPVQVLSVEKRPLRFVRDIQPILSKVGCNAGTCHGSQDGQNGFVLSLRGYDPAFDYYAFVEEIQGRRVNRVFPEQSLMLMKASGGVPHEGRRLFETDSRHYDLLHQWIKEGAKYDEDAIAARPVRLQVLPEQIDLDVPGRTQRVVVLAHYADGSTRDVTREAVLSTSQAEVATLEENQVTGVRRGEAAVLIRYEGQFGVVNIGIMGQRDGFAWQPMPEHNFIDRHINAKLKGRKILPGDLSTDAEFVRRIYLDLTGLPPTVEQARQFVEDPRPSEPKRAELIDELIGSRGYVAFWSNKWADLLQCNSEKLGEDGVWRFREWIRQSIAANKPYNQFVHELLTARGSSIDNPATGYLLSLGKDVERINNQRVARLQNIDTDKITEDVSQTFLGVRFNCNKCHDHPFERWTQNQYYEFGAYFAHLRFKPGPRTNVEEVVVYSSYEGGDIKHPKTQNIVEPRVPYGAEPSLSEDRRREAFAYWLTSADNPYFARSYVNRMWSYFLGVGIIDPVDDIRASNPPTNPALLDALTEFFIDSGFDTEALVHAIVSSRAYQLSLRTNPWNADDRINFSRFYPRRLSAEQLLDAVAQATGTQMQLAKGLPGNLRSVLAADGQVEGNDFLQLFGRPKRDSACECERTSNVSLAHALNLINGPVITEAVVDPKSAIARLVAEEPDNAKVINEMYYMILNRPATEQEIANLDLGEDPQQRLEAAQDLAWAMLNSPAFLFNR